MDAKFLKLLIADKPLFILSIYLAKRDIRRMLLTEKVYITFGLNGMESGLYMGHCCSERKIPRFIDEPRKARSSMAHKNRQHGLQKSRQHLLCSFSSSQHFYTRRQKSSPNSHGTSFSKICSRTGQGLGIIYYLRNRKHVSCFYRAIKTRVEIWENE